MSNSNGALLKQLFQLAEEDGLNYKLEEVLNNMINKMVFTSPSSVELTFRNGIEVVIKHSFDIFHLYISDPSFYDNNENAYSPMGSDRVMRYLRTIALYKYEPNR